MNNKKISVIVAVYNVEKEIERCLDSIVSQSYTDLEIILVDDGSTDRSGQICDEYGQRDKRIFVIHKENGGLSDARNFGIDAAIGEYVSFVDSDDYIAPDYISVMYEAMTGQGGDVVICGKREFGEGEKIESTLQKGYDLEHNWNTHELRCAWNTEYTDRINYAWNKLYKRELIGDFRFKKGLVGCEDWDFNLDVLLRADKITLIRNELYYYYQRSDSITHGVKSDAYYIALAETYAKQIKNIATTKNTGYCLNRMARYSLRKEFDNKEKLRKDVISVFRRAYRDNRKTVGKTKEKYKLMLAYYCYPLYKKIVGN